MRSEAKPRHKAARQRILIYSVRFAEIHKEATLRVAFISTTPLASFLGSSPLLFQAIPGGEIGWIIS